MNTEIILSNDSLEKIKKLFECFGNCEHNVDMYSICIHETLNKELEAVSL